MAFSATPVALGEGLAKLRSIAAMYRTMWLPAWDAACQAGTTASIAQSWGINITQNLTQMQALADLPGMAQYARDQLNAQGYDIVAEYNTMKTALLAVRSWIAAGLQATGTFGADATTCAPTAASYTPAQLAPLRTLLAAAYNSIS